jgi:hypothetical protein
MTLQDIQQYGQPIQIVTALMSLSSLSANSFTQDFITFAPYISSSIIDYANDNNSILLSNINFYLLLYKQECSNFIYNYLSANKLEYVAEQVMASDVYVKNLSLTGKVASTTVDDWFNFAQTVNQATFKSFSTALSGDQLLVFFM